MSWGKDDISKCLDDGNFKNVSRTSSELKTMYKDYANNKEENNVEHDPQDDER